MSTATTPVATEKITGLLLDITRKVNQNLPQLAKRITTSQDVAEANEAFTKFSNECDAIDKLLWEACTQASETHLNKVSDLLLK